MPQIGTSVRVAAMHNIVVRTAAYTAVAGDFVLANAITAGFTITLPSNPSVGAVVGVKKTDASLNVVTVVGQNNSLIDADASAWLVAVGAGADFVWDGTNWWSAGIFKESSTPAQVATGRKNAIRNGDMSIAQRGNGNFNGNAPAPYTLDGWQAEKAGNGTMTVARVPAPIGGIAQAGWMLRSVVASASAAGDYSMFYQRIEDVRTLAGKVVTLSFLAVAATGTPKIGVEVTQVFGTGGSPSATVNTKVQAVTISGTLTRYTVTFTVPSITGKTLGTGGNDYLAVSLWMSAGSNWDARASFIGIQNNTIDISEVQLEEGSGSSFERLSAAEQLAWCQRYFQRWYQPPLRGVMSTGSAARIGMPFPVTMRAVPSLTLNGTMNVYDGSVTPAITAITQNFCTEASFEIDVSHAGGGTLGRCAAIYKSGTGYIDVSAEL